MSYQGEQWFNYLPEYLLETGKGRIKEGLSQFIDPVERGKEKVYENFYLQMQKDHFMQGDLFHSIKTIEWKDESEDYCSKYTPAMLVSNSCDVAIENERLIDKEALFAPVINLKEYFEELKKAGKSDEQIKTIYSKLKQQEYSNLFYLPADPITTSEYIVFLDNIWWFPATEVHKKFAKIKEERFLSLTDWAFYLFISKISFHFCRVPEEKER